LSVAAGGWTKWYNTVCLSLNLQIWGIEHQQLSVAAGGWTKWYNAVCLSLNLQIWEIEHQQLSVAAGWTKWYNLVCLAHYRLWDVSVLSGWVQLFTLFLIPKVVSNTVTIIQLNMVSLFSSLLLSLVSVWEDNLFATVSIDLNEDKF